MDSSSPPSSVPPNPQTSLIFSPSVTPPGPDKATTQSTSSPVLVQSPFFRSLIAGAVAGTCTDLALFPLDTLKTRLQAAVGFTAAGGFTGLYKGVGSAFVGAAPGAAAFFVAYDGTYRYIKRKWVGSERSDGGGASSFFLSGTTIAPLIAGSVGELAACTIRVPTEVCKQRTQAGQFATSLDALKSILFDNNRPAPARTVATTGSATATATTSVFLPRGYFVFRELYRGWSVTVMREVPFSMIQFPIWEGCKAWWMARQRRLRQPEEQLFYSTQSSKTLSGSGPEIQPFESIPDPGAEKISVLASAIAGVFSGSIAAALTTPLDVLKTRMMLSPSNRSHNLSSPSVSIVPIAREVYRTGGVAGFFAGLGPRVGWIGGGGFVFLGSYQWAINALGGRDNETGGGLE